MKQKSGELPNKPSEILKVALEDLERVENHPNYMVNMRVWHTKNTAGKCMVCHAGAVMACRLEGKEASHNFSREKSPSVYSDDIGAKLLFINSVRIGSLEDGLSELYDSGVISRNDFHKAIELVGRDYDGYVGIPQWASLYTKGFRDQYKNYICGVIGMFESIGM